MNPSESHHHEVIDEAARSSYWQKLGGGSLSVSIALHGLLLAGGIFWVFRTIDEPVSDPLFRTGTGTPGSTGAM